MSRAYAVAERAGARPVAIAATAFMAMQRATCRGLGLDDVAITEYPGVITVDSDETFEQRVREHVVPGFLARLAERQRNGGPRRLAVAAEPAPRDIVFRGDFDAVQEYFHERMWSDGLPVVPPTIERIERFLRYTRRAPDEVLGVLLPEMREATVWNVAVNGVMAGCRPEYLPVLLAIVEAIADPEFRLLDAGSTPGWEPLVLLSGPLVKELKVNVQAGAMRVGAQANTSIGRFLRLYMRNVAGLRTWPGLTDKATIGQSFLVMLGENDEALAELGWTPQRVERGFKPEDSVVTVQSVYAVSPPIYSGGDTPASQLEFITEFLGNSIGPWAFTGLNWARFHPLLVMSPVVARVFADAGWSKDDLRRELRARLKIPAGRMELYFRHVSASRWTVADSVRAGTVSTDEYLDSDDPQRLVPMLPRAEWLGIVVAGDGGRNQSRAYINNHGQGPPVSRKVELPPDWAALRGA